MKRLFFAKYGYLTLSVLFFLAGLAYMFLPDLPEMAVCLMLGILLIVYGAVKLVGYLAPDRYSLAFQYDMASAIILLILGLLVLIFNVRAYDQLARGLGFLILLDSAMSIQISKDAAKFGIRTWVLLLVVSIITALFAVLILIDPFESGRLHHICIGLAALAEGVMKYCVVLCTVEKKERKDRRSSRRYAESR